jgi:hypothetical protein
MRENCKLQITKSARRGALFPRIGVGNVYGAVRAMLRHQCSVVELGG